MSERLTAFYAWLVYDVTDTYSPKLHFTRRQEGK